MEKLMYTFYLKRFKLNMKKLIFLLLLLITQINFGQSNIVEINTTGSGETKEEAVQNALLSALKQSFGVFISSNTEIINDVLTKDKISELSSGNILEYNIISETQNGNYFNTLVSSKISMNTLSSYTKNKVDSNEISGDVFVSNFLIKELNKENELQSIKDLIDFSKKVLPSFLDYHIESNDPVSSESVNYDFYIETKVGFNPNENYTVWKDYFNRIIQNLSLSPSEYLTYKSQKIKTFPIVLNSELYYLRSKESLKKLFEFSSNTLINTFNFNLLLKGLDRTILVKNKIKTDRLWSTLGGGSKLVEFSDNELIHVNTLECEIQDGKIIDEEKSKFLGLPLAIFNTPQRTYLTNFVGLENLMKNFENYMNYYSLDIENHEFQGKKEGIINILKKDLEQPNNMENFSIPKNEYEEKLKFYAEDAANQTEATNIKRMKELEILSKKYNDETDVKDDTSLKSTNSVNDSFNQKLLKLLTKYTGGYSGLYFNLLCLQTNYIKPGYHKINIQMNLEDLKKLRGFQITNSN